MATGYSEVWSHSNGTYTAYFRVKYSTSYNASTNKSTVSVTPQFKSSANFGTDYRIFNGSGLSGAGVYGNGSCLYSFGTNYGYGNYLSCGSAHNDYRDLGTWSFTVNHDSNGDASFTVGIYGSALAMYFSGTGYTYNQCYHSSIGSKTSSTITIHENAASSISSCPSSIETNGTLALTMTRRAATNYHIATVKYGATTLYTSSRFDTTLSFTVPRSWFTNYPTQAALSLTLSVQTYNSGGTAIGSPVTKTVTVTADADMKPSVSAGWVSIAAYNTGAVSGILGFVKGYSQAEATFSNLYIDMTDAVGASIASYSITCQGTTTSVNPPTVSVKSPVLLQDTLVCTVTDTRGRTASETFTITLMDYANPSLTDVSIFRCDANGDPDDDGQYYSAKATLTYSSLNSQNVCPLTAQHKAAGGSYGTATSLTSGTASVIGTVSPDLTYTVKISATDSLGNSAEYFVTLATRKWAMHFRPNGSGVAFGKAAETDDTFEIDDGLAVKSKGIVDLIYPVGSIYMSVNSTSPATLFGGTWVQIEDAFLLSAGQTYTAGATGGAATHKHTTGDHTLTTQEMPIHGGHLGGHTAGTLKKYLNTSVLTSYGNDPRGWTELSGSEAYPASANAGSGWAHNHGDTGSTSNLPPYLVVYMWERTA